MKTVIITAILSLSFSARATLTNNYSCYVTIQGTNAPPTIYFVICNHGDNHPFVWGGNQTYIVHSDDKVSASYNTNGTSGALIVRQYVNDVCFNPVAPNNPPETHSCVVTGESPRRPNTAPFNWAWVAHCGWCQGSCWSDWNPAYVSVANGIDK